MSQIYSIFGLTSSNTLDTIVTGSTNISTNITDDNVPFGLSGDLATFTGLNITPKIQDSGLWYSNGIIDFDHINNPNSNIISYNNHTIDVTSENLVLNGETIKTPILKGGNIQSDQNGYWNIHNIFYWYPANSRFPNYAAQPTSLAQKMSYIYPIPSNPTFAMVTFNQGSTPTFIGMYVINLSTLAWTSGTAGYGGANVSLSGQNTIITGYENTMYTGSNQGYFNQIDCSNVDSITPTNGINVEALMGNTSFELIWGISLNSNGTRAYVTFAGAGSTGAIAILDVTNGNIPWTISNILATNISAVNTAPVGSAFVNLHSIYGGSSTSACAIFTIASTSSNSNEIISYDVSNDQLIQIGSLSNISGPNMSEIRIHPSDSSILYINSGQIEVVGNTSYLWVVKINADGSLNILNQIQAVGSITDGYSAGNFVNYKSNIYYVITSNDGYINVFNANTPSNPTSIKVTNPYITSFSFSAPTLTQSYIDSNFNIYICNRTNASAPTLQYLQLLN